jgi:hypothetical protein
MRRLQGDTRMGHAWGGDMHGVWCAWPMPTLLRERFSVLNALGLGFPSSEMGTFFSSTPSTTGSGRMPPPLLLEASSPAPAAASASGAAARAATARPARASAAGRGGRAAALLTTSRAAGLQGAEGRQAPVRRMSCMAPILKAVRG